MSRLPYSDQELFDWVLRINTEFYELVYQDPWFKKIFRNIEQKIITTQQTDFMVQSMGGPKNFCGRIPKDAHPQVWVDEEIWEYREYLLRQAFETTRAPEDIRDQWLKIDQAFKHAIINRGGPDECVGRYAMDEIIYEPGPQFLNKKKAA